jgi:hypothetical protein
MSGENHKERLDRELIELLDELRVALPGVQMLFAFLLIVPFSQRFSSVTPLQRHVYFATLLCAAVSAALLIAPFSHHRLVIWRRLPPRNPGGAHFGVAKVGAREMGLRRGCAASLRHTVSHHKMKVCGVHSDQCHRNPL